jgi:hypothetical protein
MPRKAKSWCHSNEPNASQEHPPPALAQVAPLQPLELAMLRVEGALLQALQLQREARPKLLKPCNRAGTGILAAFPPPLLFPSLLSKMYR